MAFRQACCSLLLFFLFFFLLGQADALTKTEIIPDCAVAPRKHPLRMAWIISFPLEDLTWSYHHDFARERLLSRYPSNTIITTSFCCVGEDDSAGATALMNQLIEDEYDVITLQSPQLTQAAEKIAQQWPGKYLQVYPAEYAVGNLNGGFAFFHQGFYLATILAAEWSKTKKIGLCGGYNLNIVFQSANAMAAAVNRFYPGKVEIFEIEMGDWYDERLQRQCVDQLIDAHNVDVVFLYGTGFFFVSQAARRGIKSVGLHTDINSFHANDSSSIITIEFDWYPQYANFTDGILCDEFIPSFYRMGSLQDGVVKFSPFSDDVSNDARAKFQAEYNRILNAGIFPDDIFCDPIMQDLNPKGPQGCLTPEQFQMMDRFVSTINVVPGEFYYTELFWDWSDPAGIVAAALNSLGLVLLLAMFAVCLVYRETPIIRAASVPFCSVIFIAGVAAHISAFFAINKPTDWSCELYKWFAVLSVVLVGSAFTTKLFRAWRIFEGAKKLAISVIPLPILFGVIGAAIGGACVILLVWSIIDPFGPTELYQNDDILDVNISFDEVVLICDSHDRAVWRILILTYMGLILGTSTVLTFLTRDIRSAFAETKIITVIIYNLAACGIILVPIAWIFQGKWQIVYIIRVFSIIYLATSSMMLFFGSKVYTAFFGENTLDSEGSSTDRSRM